jgi:VIT1/CCC1 family predicted Fe2+/Mn2+ transporter
MLETARETCHHGSVTSAGLHPFDPRRSLLRGSGGRPNGPVQDADVALPNRLNWLRAGVLGANDGIVSTAAIVLGMAGATAERGPILFAGLIGLLAGALSMAAGEFVSVSTQRDTERALLGRQRLRLADQPAAERDALATAFVDRGLDADLAGRVADGLTTHDALAAHASTRFGVDADQPTQPAHAAVASFVAFVLGAAVPLLAAAVAPVAWYVVVAVVVALAVTGAVSARLGRSPMLPAVARNVAGGLIAMAVTFGLGSLVGGTLL